MKNPPSNLPATRRRLPIMASLFLALASTLLFTGCFGLFKADTTETRHFILTPVYEPTAKPDVQSIALGLGQVKLPGYLTGISMVVRRGTNEIAYLPRALWGERLDAGIQRVLAANLTTLLPADPVRLSAWSKDQVTVGLYVTIEQFEMETNGGAVLVAAWRIVSSDGEQLLKTGRCRLVNTGPNPSLNQPVAVAGLSALLGDFSRRLAQSVREAAPPPCLN
jgi:uncharacterized lipoprotein YmbA